MRDRRAWWIVGIVLAGGIALFWMGRPPPGRTPSIPSMQEIDAVSKGSTAAVSPSAGFATPDPRRTTTVARTGDGFVVWPGAVEASQTLNQSGQSAREDMQAVHTVLADYHTVFGEVPPGGLNEEITRGLMGDNPKKIIFLRAKESDLSASGELLDRWGTPYFFHKLSHDLIDLRSAGPDRKFWTRDDIFDESRGGPPL
ncbi:MAG: hypothetical protein PHC88_05265 [Terrimicrobiaceae bacterium]|nr:hypothetical protein [Terrimicrobiaceae bacterium]